MTAPLPTFGRFVTLGVLGQGGAGTVYLARHPQLGYEVAIKTLVHGARANERQRARFRREVLALTKFRHPGLVEVLEAGEAAGVPWFAMRRIKGGTLEEHIGRHGPLSPEETIRLGVELCGALAEAHRRGILHRDLKPDNVLRDPEGRYVVTDFGLTKTLTDSSDGAAPSLDLSKSGTLQGTPGYWAPEQAAGKIKDTDARTDVYGVGAVLYAAVTGRAPIEGSTMIEIMVATRDHPPPPPSRFAKLPKALEGLILRCLEKSPADRYSDLESLGFGLREVAGARGGPRAGSVLVWGAFATSALLAGVLTVLFLLPGGAPATPALDLLGQLQATPPRDSAEVTRRLQEYRERGEGPKRLAKAEAWARDWEALFKAEQAMNESDVGRARELTGARSPDSLAPWGLVENDLACLDDYKGLLTSLNNHVLDEGHLARWRSIRERKPRPVVLVDMRRHWHDVLVSRLALAAYRAEVADYPQSQAGWIRFHESYIRLSFDGDAALSDFRSLARGGPEIGPEIADAAMGLVHIVGSKHSQARPLLEQAYRAKPEFVIAGLLTGVAVQRSGDDVASLAIHQDYLGPKGIQYYIWAARIAVGLKDAPRARRSGRIAIKLLPDPVPLGSLLSLYMTLEPLDRPLVTKLLGRAKAQQPNSLAVLLLEGVALNEKGRTKESLEVWNRARRLNPEPFAKLIISVYGEAGAKSILGLLDQLEARTETPSKAKHFSLPLDRGPSSAGKHAVFQTRQIADPAARSLAEEAWRQLIEGAPWSSVAPTFMRAREKAPKDSGLAWSYAQALLGRDRLPEAAEALSRAKELGVNAAVIEYFLAEVDVRLGKHARATRRYRAIIAGSKPGHRIHRLAALSMWTLGPSGTDDPSFKKWIETLSREGRTEVGASALMVRVAFKAGGAKVRPCLENYYRLTGWSDSLTITYYLIERSATYLALVGKGQVPPLLLKETAAVTAKNAELSRGAWSRLAPVRLALLRKPFLPVTTGIVEQNLRTAGRLEPDRADVHVLKGVFLYRRSGSTENTIKEWRIAKEKGASPDTFLLWQRSFSGLRGPEFEEFKR